MKTLIQIAVVLFLSYAPVAMSCNYDTDCGIDSSCVIPKGEESGYCLDNSAPEQEAKEKSIRKRLDARGKSGKSCTSDRECGLGNRCLRQAGRLRGSCE